MSIIFTNPSAQAGYDTRSVFKQSLTGLNSEFFLLLDKAEEPSLSYYWPIAGGRIIGFIPFPRVLVLCEMQSASSRVWTCVAMYIYYDDNHHTTGTSTISWVSTSISSLTFLFELNRKPTPWFSNWDKSLVPIWYYDYGCLGFMTYQSL